MTRTEARATLAVVLLVVLWLILGDGGQAVIDTLTPGLQR